MSDGGHFYKSTDIIADFTTLMRPPPMYILTSAALHWSLLENSPTCSPVLGLKLKCGVRQKSTTYIYGVH